MILRSFLVWAACLAAWPAAALLTRPDRDDAEYLELASRYASSTTLGANAGEAVLIAPRWLATSARRATELKSPAVSIGGRSYAIQSISIHPAWNGGRENAIALIFLREPVAGIEPTPIYRHDDEADDAVVIAGHGATGHIGDAAAKPSDGRLRAGINTIDRVDPLLFAMRIKPADEASDLQAAIARNETGAPAYLQVNGALFVAGIAVESDDTNGDGIAGSVGDWEHYVRVSAFAPWIDDTMFTTAVTEAAAATTPGKAPSQGGPKSYR